jgi:DNA-binding CsgD family transcriptional regulator
MSELHARSSCDRRKCNILVKSPVKQVVMVQCVLDSDQQKRPLTLRELTVLSLAAQGMPDKQIAELCRVRVSTIRTYWERIYEKLNATNRTHAACMVVSAGLITVPGVTALRNQREESEGMHPQSTELRTRLRRQLSSAG